MAIKKKTKERHQAGATDNIPEPNDKADETRQTINQKMGTRWTLLCDPV